MQLYNIFLWMNIIMMPSLKQFKTLFWMKVIMYANLPSLAIEKNTMRQNCRKSTHFKEGNFWIWLNSKGRQSVRIGMVMSLHQFLLYWLTLFIYRTWSWSSLYLQIYKYINFHMLVQHMHHFAEVTSNTNLISKMIFPSNLWNLWTPDVASKWLCNHVALLTKVGLGHRDPVTHCMSAVWFWACTRNPQGNDSMIK